MTPEEKAKHLIYSFVTVGKMDEQYAARCVYLCVNEILSILPYSHGTTSIGIRDYWEEVKDQIKEDNLF